VRQAAAKALAAVCWADGWAACHGHADADVRAVIAPLLNPLDKEPLANVWAIGELLRGLSSSADTRAFCQTALETLTGKKMQAEQWAAWWKQLGNPRSGLLRSGPNLPPEVDQAIDFGGWWQCGHMSIQNRPNPLLKYELPATVQWKGFLLVSQPGEYRFYIRNCGESIRAGKRVVTPGRMGFPGLFFSSPRAKLLLDGKAILPGGADDAMLDPAGGIRVDFGPPLKLEKGLHEILVEFEIRSYDDLAAASKAGLLGGQPCIRLYWSSEHFLRQLIGTDRLITKD
jgi:hypothetical protein